jgi:hypothetical protein
MVVWSGAFQRLSIIKFSRATSRVKWFKVTDFSILRSTTEMVLETLVFSPFNHLTRLVARRNFIIKDIVILCKIVLQHALPIIPLMS